MIDARIWRRFAAAAGVSAIAHAVVATVGHIQLPEAPPERMPVAVRLVGASGAVAPVAPAVAPVGPTSRVARAEPGVRVAPIGRHSPVPAAAAAAEDAPSEEAVVADAAEPEPTAPAAIAVDESPKVEPEVVAEAARPALTLPRKGRITYELVYGRDRFPVGRTVQTWEVDRGRYQLASRSETTGLADLIRSRHLAYSSKGAFTNDGLRPDAFRMNRNRGKGVEEASAQFDWTRATVTLGKSAETRQEKLPPRSQDLLSFMYQLSLDPPPPGRVRQVVTNGSRIEVYELDVLREEKLETPLGVLRVLPIKQVRKGNEESIELWLALEYRNLPVRLRFFDKQGEPQGEQIVAEIRLQEN